MDKANMQTMAFQLIGHAGDAFDAFYRAIDSARGGNIEEANKIMKEGQASLSLAHQSQTNLLTSEAKGENIEFSVIMIHAQDHLMTTIMFERVAREFITLYAEREDT
ncbi:cellobiose-specific phosphotransferase system component IIA [Breznakia sp. PF5-3]|uniref:PTS lactose/cellobiose transporter subunit IIA n=1 Tax=unclassified Breznakia TaxID=2623764 RepID=UPI002405EDF8|nr:MULTISPECIES: PTS lactose/cellobiose transporter subunit IIA [unclassified Breznakia]MDF9824522.1 cellobiose-specific phosphotransferase system component IIA [Breznakia sp. PM6-1]MDF9835308.1 cellobiose-specific phosphotransferase system component IIA [Breznakia sp. PF5-3]MDF9837024.1 cellobiose-specific phosphotransferase system component IIA [Breznakia sp. PFB2-8]MDF9858949.1 cellobiose-specific phosphotransferase system component IIA [Breznakia sp. PH5-24]